MVLLKDETANDTEEGVNGDQVAGPVGRSVDWVVRATRRAVRQVLSGPCLQYFLGAHVACQLRAADGGALYGLPGPAAAALPLLEGCSSKCACTEQVRSGGMLGAVRCWWIAHTARTGLGPISMLYDKAHVHTMCMRLAVAALASYNRGMAAGGSGSGDKGRKNGRGRGRATAAKSSRQGGGRQLRVVQGVGAAEGAAGQQPWERLPLSRALMLSFPVCLEALLAAAAALQVPPLRCREELTRWDDDDDDKEYQQQQRQQQEQPEEGEEGAQEEKKGRRKAQGLEPRISRIRQWWAVAVPALHAALDAVSAGHSTPLVVLQQVLDLAALPPLEPGGYRALLSSGCTVQ